MTSMRDAVGGIVLAGGRSSRFGVDKLSADVGGRPLLAHAIDAVRRVAADVVVVLAPAAAPADLPSGVRVAHDPEAHGGPLVGLLAGLDALATDRVVVVGGDMPTVVQAVLALLIDALDASPAAILHDGERARPLPMSLHRAPAATAARTLRSRDERRLRALLAALGAREIPPATWRPFDPAGDSLVDVDRPEDLPGLQGGVGQQPGATVSRRRRSPGRATRA